MGKHNHGNISTPLSLLRRDVDDEQSRRGTLGGRARLGLLLLASRAAAFLSFSLADEVLQFARQRIIIPNCILFSRSINVICFPLSFSRLVVLAIARSVSISFFPRRG
jgi:hypothetical protein